MPVHEIKIISDKKEVFEYAIKAMFAAQWSMNKATMKGYKIKDGKFHIDFYSSNDFLLLPFPMKREMAIEFIWEWLQHTPYPKNTYTGDGDTKKGFEIKSNWEGNYVAPFYTIYGK